MTELDAAACGYSPEEAKYIDFGDRPKKQAVKPRISEPTPSAQVQAQPEKAIQAMEMLREAVILTRPQFLACKAAILK